LMTPLKLTHYLDTFYKVSLNQSLINMLLLSGNSRIGTNR